MPKIDSMFDYSNSNVEKVSVHQVGNKNNGDYLVLSNSPLDTSNSTLKEMLQRYFLASFTTDELYHFTFSNDDFKLNPLYVFADTIFDNKDVFHENSINIAKHLFEVSLHPQIKAGDLFVAYITDVTVDGETIDAIGIFKSENRHAFLKLDRNGMDFSLVNDEGINIEKLDKGCLIFNTAKDSGYRIAVIDKLNKTSEAQYWKDQFLILRTVSNEFQHTKNFLNITKNFITQQLPEDFQMSKTDQIDLLNRSVNYFKTHEHFEKEDFEKEVFFHEETIQSFRKYDENYRQNHEVELADNFIISNQAVKKQAKIFKSILKLDKNFHIYIHGNNDLIEQGTEPDGRKYYKIYYREES